MKFILTYCLLFLLSILLWHPLYASDKYLLPLVPLIILFLARAVVRDRRVKLIAFAILLANFAFIAVSAIKQISDNVAYLHGDKYAGYDAKTRAFFVELETADLPQGAEIFCRKPEFLYILRGVKSRYPWDEEKK